MQSSAHRAFKAITSKIHPQLPLNPRESQQLLTVLTDSFKHHLDHEHPISSSHPTKSSSNPLPVSSVSSAVQHLDTVLTNPLLSGTHGHGESSSRFTPAEARRLVDNPLQWFEAQVAAGSATVWKADSCLHTIVNALPKRSPAARQATMKEMRAGSKIYSWLWSCNLIESKDFIKRPTLIQNMGLFLGAEGRYDILRRLVSIREERLVEDQAISLDDVLKWKAHLLQGFIKLELSRSETRAIELFLQAMAMLDASPAHMQSIASLSVSYFFRRYSLRSPSHTSPRSTPPEVFSKWIETAPKWTKHWRLCQAILWLHHPTKPQTQPGLAFLNAFELPRSEEQTDLEWSRRGVVTLARDLTHQLLEEGKHADAQWTYDFMKKNFPEELGLQKSKLRDNTERKQINDRELTSLQVLDGLAVT